MRRFAAICTLLACFGASLFAWPGVGDSIRTPQWLWAAGSGLVLAAVHLASGGKPMLTKLRNSVPDTLFLWLLFLAAHASAAGEPARSLITLALPAFVALGAAFVVRSGALPAASAFRKMLGLVTIIQLLWGALQVAGRDPLFTRVLILGQTEPAGFQGQPTFFALLLAWLAFYWAIVRNWWLVAACAAGLWLARSAFGWASLLYGAFWFLWCRGWKKISSSLALVGLAVGPQLFFYGADNPGFLSNNGRLHVWVYSVNAILEKPWLGYGIAEFSREFPAYHQANVHMRWEEAHNELIEYVFNTGLVGLAALLPFLVTVGIRLWRMPMTPQKELAVGTLLMIGVNAMGSFPLQIAPFATLAIYAIAWALRPLPEDTPPPNFSQ